MEKSSHDLVMQSTIPTVYMLKFGHFCKGFKWFCASKSRDIISLHMYKFLSVEFSED